MSRRKVWLVLLATLATAAVAAGIAVAGQGNGNDKTFQYAIGLWGDLPYSDVQAQTGVPNLIADMNSQDIQFSVHDGDLKAGNSIPGSVTPTTCQNTTQPSIYTQGLGYFNSLTKPAIFTPGDNDWTDCDRTSNGGFNSLERLQYERGLFFSTDQSLGQHTMTLEVQTAPLCQGTTSLTGQPRFMTGCVENRRWTFHGVTYATLDVQGTCNNLCSSGAGDPGGDVPEYAARETADEAWLHQTFDEARSHGSAAVMIIWQADPGFDTSGYQGAPKRKPNDLMETDGNPDGFHDILSALRDETIAFEKPVVLVHGDSHWFMVDKPLHDSHGRTIENFTRVETFGDHTFGAAHPDWDTNYVHWVKVLVDPQSRDVFAFQPQVVPANRVAVPAP
ncbi:MAG TPA: hypothetical protein VKB73_04270 [Gaiellaceae bacterium]|nr:hypothetical protein [Gaiellaceae bacterium]